MATLSTRRLPERMSSFCTAVVDGEECGAKSENKDLGLCATHNKARRKAEQPAPERKVCAMPRATAPMRPVSAKKAVALRAKAVAYKEVDATAAHVCVSCGSCQMLTHSHVLPVGNFPEFEATPANILLECQECHMVWEHDKHRAALLHASWSQKMRIIWTLAPWHYSLKFQGVYPNTPNFRTMLDGLDV